MPHPPRRDARDERDSGAPPRRQRPKIGLALGAGVARGWAHIGVVRRLAEKGIPVDVVAGTSIGAVVGGALAADRVDALEDWVHQLSGGNFLRFLDLRFGRGGLFGGEKLRDLMEDNFAGMTFGDTRVPFTAVSTELKSGHEIWLTEGALAPAIQSSFALPGVFEPVKIGRRWLVDGALVNPVPTSVCRAAGCDLVIAVNLAEDFYGRRRATRAGALAKGHPAQNATAAPENTDSSTLDDEGIDDGFGVFSEWDTAATSPDTRVERKENRFFLRRLMRHRADAPSLFANMVASLNIMQNRLSRSRLAGDPPDITITPRCGHVGLMEFHRGEELITEGRRAFDAEEADLMDALAIITHRMNS
ncbi:patatin-like phospholipase family protein [Yunchengibacter salinarum]|uniref:patatin-like phospholipase family protein n=1 Tax=Yunchengibacter salinarum TaxID=3133399 RepID=UPI0035B5E2E6